MRKTKKLYRILDIANVWETSRPNPMKDIEYVEDGQMVKVVTGQGVRNALIMRYPTYRFFDSFAYTCAETGSDYNVGTAWINFTMAWNTFVANHPEYAYIGQMLNRRDYDPLENYDRKEDGGWKDTMDIGQRERTLDDDSVHNMEYDTVTTVTENDPKLKTKTTGKVYPDDGSTAMNDTESITEPVRDQVGDVDTITTNTSGHTDSSNVIGNVVTTDAEAQDVTTRLFQNYHVHGNIGVTTAAQMIQGEIDVRSKNNLYEWIVSKFVSEYLTLGKEVVIYDD